jgi:hypothetical protein
VFDSLNCYTWDHNAFDSHGKRAAYIMRLVPKDAKFSKTRLLALRKLGQNLAVVDELLKTHYPEAL